MIDDIELYPVKDIASCDCELNLTASAEEDNLTDFPVGDTLTLKNILFEINSFELDKSSNQALKLLSNHLASRPELKVHIIGHTDNSGSDSYNLTLSDQRAKAVKNWLVEDGIEHNRVFTRGVGNQFPLKGNTNSELNRHVELIIKEE